MVECEPATGSGTSDERHGISFRSPAPETAGAPARRGGGDLDAGYAPFWNAFTVHGGAVTPIL